MEISSLNTNYYDVYALDDVSTDNQIIDRSQETSEEPISIEKTNGLESPATAVAINPIPQESIELQELQTEIVSEFENLQSGEISQDDFRSTLEELGVQNNSNNTQSSNNEDPLRDLTSSLIESVKGNAQDGNDIRLSEYASVMDLVNKETQSPEVNEQLQAYTQNLRY